MEIYTTGFTKKRAAQFFGSLRQANIQRLLDVRLNNSSQLAGFAKKEDLSFFLAEICHIEYQHEPLLAPTQEMLDAYKKQKGSWSYYEQRFLALMRDRRIEADHKTPKENLIREINARIQDGSPVILSVGLTRPWRHPDDSVERHWLQVNNFHLKDEVVW